MKPLKLATICLVFTMAVMVVIEAEAGRKKKSSKGTRTEKAEEMKTPRRFDRSPTMDFISGTLSRNAHSGWKVGDTALYFHRNCVITMEGAEDGWLAEGSQAIVMGSRVGSAISAWSIHVAQPEYKTIGLRRPTEAREAGPNPNVGKILSPVE